MKSVPHQITRDELIKMLEMKNYQYGELCNKYASLKYEFERLQEEYRELKIAAKLYKQLKEAQSG